MTSPLKITLILSRYGDDKVEDYINHHHYTHIYDGMEAVNNAISNFVDEEDVVFFHQLLYIKNEILEGLNISRFDERNINNIVDSMGEEDELIIYNIFNVDTINNLQQEHPGLKVLVATKESPNEIMKQIKIDGFL
jgi:hypothetical protein